MPLYMTMSQNINETTRHLKFRYISILTNLLRTIFYTSLNKRGLKKLKINNTRLHEN